ncbi:MAG: HTH domain-containing protein [Methanocorpusculum sp.]|nr:HTH domain-containing protein [Methanocorpusculum sp.]
MQTNYVAGTVICMVHDNVDTGLELVMQYLRNSKYGMSISELSRRTKVNRNTVSRYLQILSTLGQAEMHIVGAARVYQLSERLPISMVFLRAQPEPTCVINSDGDIIWVNSLMEECFEKNGQMPEGGICKKKFAGSGFPLFDVCAALPEYAESMEGKMPEGGKWVYVQEEFGRFRLWILPIVFHDGTPGVMVQIETWGVF